jgi:hypothetical protein
MTPRTLPRTLGLKGIDATVSRVPSGAVPREATARPGEPLEQGEGARQTAAKRAMARAGACLIAAAAVVVGWTSGPARALDVEPWDRVLRAHAHGGGMDYAALKADAAAMADLDAFLASVASMPESEPLYAWLDAYNAIVVKSIVLRYPLRSVRDVPGFFDRARHRVAGRERTLDEIENQIVRPRFRDARVHAALNCGARGCPALASRAFTAANVEAALDRLARAMVANDAHVRVREGRIELSEIFEWFKADFERDAGSVRAWLARYDARGKLANLPPDARLATRPYDWRLNDFPRAR